MKPLLTLCLLFVSILATAQQPFSISFELTNGVLRDTVTVGYNPIATNVIDPQLGEVDITSTPYKPVDIRSIAMPTNCIIDSAFSGFSAVYETKVDYKPGFSGLRSRYMIGQSVYGWSVQQYDSNTYFLRCILPPQRFTLNILDQLTNNSRSYYELTLYYYSGTPNCLAFAILPLTSIITPGTSLFEFNRNSLRTDTNVIIAFTKYQLTTSLPKTLAAAQLQLRQNVLTATTAFKPERVEAVDYLGRVQHQGEWSKDQASYELPLQSGIWFLRLYYNGQPTVLRVRVEG